MHGFSYESAIERLTTQVFTISFVFFFDQSVILCEKLQVCNYIIIEYSGNYGQKLYVCVAVILGLWRKMAEASYETRDVLLVEKNKEIGEIFLQRDSDNQFYDLTIYEDCRHAENSENSRILIYFPFK